MLVERALLPQAPLLLALLQALLAAPCLPLRLLAWPAGGRPLPELAVGAVLWADLLLLGEAGSAAGGAEEGPGEGTDGARDGPSGVVAWGQAACLVAAWRLVAGLREASLEAVARVAAGHMAWVHVAWALEVVRQVAVAQVETAPSGTGPLECLLLEVHLLGRGQEACLQVAWALLAPLLLLLMLMPRPLVAPHLMLASLLLPRIVAVLLLALVLLLLLLPAAAAARAPAPAAWPAGWSLPCPGAQQVLRLSWHWRTASAAAAAAQRCCVQRGQSLSGTCC